ncbi:MAG: proton-conducting membrane transporter [Clostridiales bacterium]|nr:proton-conducting membrane transporter [Clostridiales bacterium]
MKETVWVIVPVLIPVIMGIFLLFMKPSKSRKTLLWITAAGLFVTAGLVGYVLSLGDAGYTLFYLTDTLPVFFRVDSVSRLFVSVVTFIWICSGLYAFEYMKHEENNKRYFGFYLLVYGILVGLDFSGNLVTFYMFYELMTLLSMPLVLHNRSHEAVMAGLKYLFYSFFGAYMVLFGIYFIYHYANTMSFTAGGVFDAAVLAENRSLLLAAAFLMLIGFGVKAGMFPLHAWLPTAHPVAPAPASAALSGIIVKGGVLGIVRVVFYIFGADFLKGTWVQTVWMTLALLTVFMGSMLAFLEKGFKKRLAYSTVSQISYILFGLSVLQPVAVTGALLHVVFHAIIKCTLFLCAGAVIYQTGKTKVEELSGIGKQMPVTIWCYTFVSLALIGIPPTSGFVSKWYLATGALQSGTGIFTWLGPVVLLLSALLTAGYLLPVTVKGFLPGNDFDYVSLQKREANGWMLMPILLLTICAVALGMFPNSLAEFFAAFVPQLM